LLFQSGGIGQDGYIVYSTQILKKEENSGGLHFWSLFDLHPSFFAVFFAA
jgi:hypothetical protein